MGYWTKTAVVCAVSGIIGAYAGTYLTFNRAEQQEKELARLITAEKPEKTLITDVNDDWVPDVIMQKQGKYKIFLGQSSGTFKLTTESALEKKARQMK